MKLLFLLVLKYQNDFVDRVQWFIILRPEIVADIEKHCKHSLHKKDL